MATTKKYVTWGLPIVLTVFLISNLLWSARQGQDQDNLLQEAQRQVEQDPQQAIELYQEALNYGADKDTVESALFSLQQQQVGDEASQLVYMLAEADSDSWTTQNNRRYAQFLGQTSVLAVSIDSDTALTDQEIETLSAIIEEDISEQNWEQVQFRLQQALSSQPENALWNYQLGILLAIENPDTALGYLSATSNDSNLSISAQQLQQVIDLNPDYSNSYYQSLGVRLVDQRQYAFAEYALSKAIEFDNFDWFSYAYRGFSRDQIGRSGLTDLETSIALSQGASLPYYLLGLHYREREIPNLVEAQSAFSEAYRLDPTNPALALELGKTFEQRGRLTEAAEWFGVTVALEDDNIEWRREQSRFYADEAYVLEDGEGLAILETNYELFPDDADIEASLGRAYFYLDRGEDASYHLARAVSLDDDNMRARFFYANLLQAAGDIPSAINSYKTIVDRLGNEMGYGLLADRALREIE